MKPLMRKPFGQHFLFDPRILNRIIDCSNISPHDTILEIGPGLGTLTKLLARRARKVIALEIDKKLISKLRDSLSPYPNVELITADALKFPYGQIKGTFKVVANLPYYITTPLFFRLMEYKIKIPSMTLLVQKEVARRMTARPGEKDYGVLSITTQLYTEPELKFSIARGAFSPPPKVDSAVVYFQVYPEPLFKMKDEEFFLRVVKSAFSQRRKTIANSLKSFDGVKEALHKTGINVKQRPETLSIQDYINLSHNLQKSHGGITENS
jgi:16S rRNA (adenine1518-N6/adenine1519-N6)-dimethyltransferase